MNRRLSPRETLVGASLKLGVIASGMLGITQHSVDLTGGFVDSIFVAYTTQTNIWAAATCLVFLSIDLSTRGTRRLPQWLYVIKYVATTSILLTWFGFAVLLSPTVPIEYLVSPSNIFLHNLTPILALLDFVLFDRQYDPYGKPALFTLIMPIAYVLFFIAAYELTGRLPAPYFFLDYQKCGWLRIGADGIGVVYWVLMLSVVLIGMGAGILDLRGQCREKPVVFSVIVIAAMLGLSVVCALISLLLPASQIVRSNGPLPH